MALNDAFDILNTAITDFDTVAIEDLGEFVLFRKVLGDEVEELVTDIGCHVFVVGRVEPCYVSLSILWSRVFSGWIVRKGFSVTTIIGCLFKRDFCLIEDGFIR